MPSDFGDECGEKLFDWMVRIGQDVGQETMLASAAKLADAFRRAREGLGPEGAADGQTAEWAKLKMDDFSELPAYDSIKELISEELGKAGVEHAFANEAGSESLVFKVKDVHEVSEVFERLEQKAVSARDRAKGAVCSKDRDAEPLEQRAASAREASKALDGKRGGDREVQLSQSISK